MARKQSAATDTAVADVVLHGTAPATAARAAGIHIRTLMRALRAAGVSPNPVGRPRKTR